MKIIDLLNKIANGEGVPKKIRINGCIYEYQGDDYLFIDINNDNHEYWLFSDGYTDKFQWLENYLRVEIEIIEEEKKIPEKINKSYNIRILDLDKSHSTKDYDIEQLIEMVQDIYSKQSEIIDYLKSKGE